MKHGRSLVSLAQELERQNESKRDLLVSSRKILHTTDEAGTSRISIDFADGGNIFGITEVARRQLADKLGIPFPYFERMRSTQPRLLDNNVNTWLEASDERRLIRTLDGNVRAILSERYRRLDNYDLANYVLPILQRLPGTRIESVQLTDKRMYIKAITETVKREVAPGDIVQAGVAISNSEVGHGTLSVQPLVFRLVCRNGLIASDLALRKTHLGRISEVASDAVVLYQEDTLRADDQAFFLKVRDVVQAAVSEATLRVVADRMQKAIGIRLMQDPVKTVELVAKRYYLNDVEGTGVLRHLIEGGDLSGYGLINAVTGYSQEVDDYDRATDFETLGGRLLDQTHAQWQQLAEAGAIG